MSKGFFLDERIADVADGVERTEAKHSAVIAAQRNGLADTAADILTGNGGDWAGLRRQTAECRA